MKTIISVQAKTGSSRGLVHYIAHSKIDGAKEPADCRELFNQYADEIAVEKANDFLKNGSSAKRPANEELLHLVVSLRLEDYDKLGADEKEKQKSLKDAVRCAIKKLENEINAERLNWAAAVHRNTDNPHVHIAVQKQYFDRNSEQRQLNKIPPQILPHYERVEQGEKRFAEGVLIEAVNEKLAEIAREKTKDFVQAKSPLPERVNSKTPEKSQSQKQTMTTTGGEKNIALPAFVIERDREILARAILAKYYLEKTRENLDSLENHGDKRRFKIFDAMSGKTRRMSLFDLEQRALKTANRAVKKQKITDAVGRGETRDNLAALEMQKNSDAIKRIKAILVGQIVRENKELEKRESDYQKFHPAAEKLQREYRQANKKLPAPNLTNDELEMLQAASLEKKDLRAAAYFERVRGELALERKQPTRNDEQLGKLKAIKILQDLRVRRGERQFKNFDERKRHFPVEIAGKKSSLAKIESLINERGRSEQTIAGKVGIIFNKIGLTQSENVAEKLAEVKTTIAEKLSEKAETLSEELRLEKATLKLLNEFYENDTNPRKETLAPDFTPAQLAEVESLAFELKLPDVYRENWQAQKSFIESGNANELKRENFIAGRAVAREILCEAGAARAREELASFKKNKEFQKFEIGGDKTDEVKFASLKEVEFDSRGSILDQTLEFFTENREKRRTRHQLEKIVKEKEVEFKENLNSARQFQKIAAEDARDYKTKSFFGAVNYTRAPVFTPKELVTIELRIKQTENKTEASKLQKILDSADHSKAENLSAVLARFSAGGESPKTAEQQPMKEQTAVQTAAKTETKTERNQIEIRENKAENFSHERGR